MDNQLCAYWERFRLRCPDRSFPTEPIVLDGSGAPLCIIETTEVEWLPFFEVDAAFAYDEGEGDLSLEYWREAHERFFSRTLPNVGKSFVETMPVV